MTDSYGTVASRFEAVAAELAGTIGGDGASGGALAGEPPTIRLSTRSCLLELCSAGADVRVQLRGASPQEAIVVGSGESATASDLIRVGRDYFFTVTPTATWGWFWASVIVPGRARATLTFSVSECRRDCSALQDLGELVE